MATYVNFTSLQEDIRRYIERGFTATSDPTVYEQIPRLINAAERKLAQALKLLGQIEVLRNPTGLQAGQSVLTKPDRWRQTVSISYGAGGNSNSVTPLFPRSLDYCRMYWPDASLMDVPLFFADYDINHWLVVPTPVQTYPLELLAYMLPVLLDDTNQENFWSRLAPNAILYGALLEATPFLRDDARIPIWQGFWQTELAMLSGQDLQRQLDRAADRGDRT